MFVEVGAHDGLENSNTIYFEDRGWTGLVIEGDTRNFAACRENRPKAFVGVPISTQKTVCFVEDPKSDWSGIRIADRPGQRAVKLDAMRLDTLLDQNNIQEIDLLSIDTEGTELDVWASFDPDKYKPKVVIMEYDTVGQPLRDQEIMGVLAGFGYLRVHRTPGNLIFIRTIA